MSSAASPSTLDTICRWWYDEMMQRGSVEIMDGHQFGTSPGFAFLALICLVGGSLLALFALFAWEMCDEVNLLPPGRFKRQRAFGVFMRLTFWSLAACVALCAIGLIVNAVLTTATIAYAYEHNLELRLRRSAGMVVALWAPVLGPGVWLIMRLVQKHRAR